MMKMNKTLLMVLALSVAGILYGNQCDAGIFTKKKKKADTTQRVEPRKTSEYDKFFKEKHEVADGMIKLHRMKDKLYFELPLKLLGRDMLLGSTVSEISDNANAIVGSKPVDPLHFRFSKIDDKICIALVSSDNIAPQKDTSIRRSLGASNIDAIIKTFKIEVYTPDSSAVVFDATDFFVSDDPRMTPFDPYSANMSSSVRRSERFHSDKSSIDGIKSFPDNVVVRSVLTYTYSMTGKMKNLPTDVPLTAVMTRSIVLLPEVPARPRITDSRVAIFPTGKIKYSGDNQAVKVIYYANRWRLEPADSAAFARGELSEPVKPITFYVDTDFPEAWKPHIREGLYQWNELFEGIGFKNAVRVADFPKDDPEFDPDNIKYSCIRYAPVPIANAMGPSWVDPRSGEIINASIYVYHDVISLLNNWLFIQTSQTDPRVRHATIPEDIIGDGLRYVVSHEMGHCLGFMHNMGASAVIPVDSLRSPSFTQRYGTTTSIMDYARFNYVAQPGDMQRGVKMTPPRFGEYDKFLIKWNYTPLPEAATAEDEYKITSKWLTDASADPVLRYGKQQFNTIDPRSQNEDLGDNSMKASAYGIGNLKYILSNMNGWLENEDYDYSQRQALYEGIIMQYLTYMIHVYANVGGIYLNEKFVGDHVDAFRSVPRERQKEAVRFLLDQIADLDWIDNAALMQNLRLMGSPADALRGMVVKAILSSPAKVEFSASKAKGKPYSVKECFEDIYKYVWDPTIKGRKLTQTQIKLQKLFLANVGTGAGIPVAVGIKAVAGISAVAENGEVREMSLTHQPTPKCLCGHNHAAEGNGGFNPVAGYGDPSPMFDIPKDYNGLYYGYLLKIRSLLSSRQNHPDKETSMHYKLMLHNINKALK